MISALIFVLFVVIGYLSGSVCSAVIVCRIFDLPDPRTRGSRNPGATNVLRLAGKQYAAIVLVADMLKGFIPVLLATLFDLSPSIVAFTAFAAVMGHIFPVFFNFKGGKGVATAIGALFGIHLMLGVAVAATWLLVANFFRYASLASIIAMILTPFYAIIITHDTAILLPLSLLMLFVLYQHRDNFTRLMDRTESKIQMHHHDISDIADQLFNTKKKAPHKIAKKRQNKTVAAKKGQAKGAKRTTKSTKKTTTKTAKKTAKKTATKTAKKKPKSAK